MSAAEIPARPGLELEAAQTGRAASLIFRGHLDAHGVPRLRVAIDAALARPNVLVYLDLVDVTAAGLPGAAVRAAGRAQRHVSGPGFASSSRLGDTSRRTSRDHGRMSSTNPDSMERERLGGKFWIGVVLAAIACGVGAILAFALFGFAWAAFGLIGAIIVFVALAATAAWAMDRRARRRWS